MVDLVVAETADGPDEADKEEFVHPIFRMVPKEDSGSDTLRNYRYQTEVTAQTCITMLTADNIDYVVCEWHEDYVVAYTDGSVELVSVKHRAKSRTPWNLQEICKDGGLAHLFDRWRACDGAGNVRLRLATNAGLATGKTGAAALAAMCGPDPKTTVGVDAMAEAVSRHFLKIRLQQPYATIPKVPDVSKLADIVIPAGFTDLVKSFFAVLHIDAELSSRGDITDVNLQRLLRPAVELLQRENVDIEATYLAVVERIDKANRDESDRAQYAAYIADPSRVRHNVQIQQRIARRTLYRRTILDEFVSSRAAVPTFARGKTPIAAPGGANLRKKLARGGVPSDQAAHAERLRSAWYTTWEEHRSGLAGDTSDLANVSLEVVDAAFASRDQAENEALDGAPYGRRMNQLLTQRLLPENLSSSLAFPVNGQHLRGLAYELCDQCDFYFSEPFDTSEEEAS
ncbi:dsDNA nuclease domain-containing protein [Kitasatospora sp. YST-16]|uniref:dsDNA nuclease domain-containing protein n=1 Tax=Kitasatospora sp. YST-16 TaxID=2998080 RepID=UPI002283AF68|nr:dsDNA nuclease domain-containing protein [Kitasatospora sp. YST-16]WAL74683.1 dsDNA nuclease domain-containing protein [Kitasatospora sp. YST-16]WNW40738.1 dsDNA nuclease domain-containing protein [Streptomyces sp. Li-HN-5-13]